MNKVDLTKEKFLVFAGSPGYVESSATASYAFYYHEPLTLFEFLLKLYEALLRSEKIRVFFPRKEGVELDLFDELRYADANDLGYTDNPWIEFFGGPTWLLNVTNSGEEYKALVISHNHFERFFYLPIPEIQDWIEFDILTIKHNGSNIEFKKEDCRSTYTFDGCDTDFPTDFLEDFYDKIEAINFEFLKPNIENNELDCQG